MRCDACRNFLLWSCRLPAGNSLLPPLRLQNFLQESWTDLRATPSLLLLLLLVSRLALISSESGFNLSRNCCNKFWNLSEAAANCSQQAPYDSTAEFLYIHQWGVHMEGGVSPPGPSRSWHSTRKAGSSGRYIRMTPATNAMPCHTQYRTCSEYYRCR